MFSNLFKLHWINTFCKTLWTLSLNKTFLTLLFPCPILYLYKTSTTVTNIKVGWRTNTSNLTPRAPIVECILLNCCTLLYCSHTLCNLATTNFGKATLKPWSSKPGKHLWEKQPIHWKMENVWIQETMFRCQLKGENEYENIRKQQPVPNFWTWWARAQKAWFLPWPLTPQEETKIPHSFLLSTPQRLF